MGIVQLSNTKIKNSLIRWFDNATIDDMLNGVSWYDEPQKFAKETASNYCLDRYTVAGIISALSPNNKWERNKIDTIAVIEASMYGASPDSVKVCTYNNNKLKAFRIMKGFDIITEQSPKTHSFAMNIGLLSPAHVTIDKWHLRACQCNPCDDPTNTLQETCSPLQYRRIERITAELAKKYGYTGYQFQAIIWCAIKRTWNR